MDLNTLVDNIVDDRVKAATAPLFESIQKSNQKISILEDKIESLKEEKPEEKEEKPEVNKADEFEVNILKHEIATLKDDNIFLNEKVKSQAEIIKSKNSLIDYYKDNNKEMFAEVVSRIKDEDLRRIKEVNKQLNLIGKREWASYIAGNLEKNKYKNKKSVSIHLTSTDIQWLEEAARLYKLPKNYIAGTAIEHFIIKLGSIEKLKKLAQDHEWEPPDPPPKRERESYEENLNTSISSKPVIMIHPDGKEENFYCIKRCIKTYPALCLNWNNITDVIPVQT